MVVSVGPFFVSTIWIVAGKIHPAFHDFTGKTAKSAILDSKVGPEGTSCTVFLNVGWLNHHFGWLNGIEISIIELNPIMYHHASSFFAATDWWFDDLRNHPAELGTLVASPAWPGLPQQGSTADGVGVSHCGHGSWSSFMPLGNAREECSVEQCSKPPWVIIGGCTTQISHRFYCNN